MYQTIKPLKENIFIILSNLFEYSQGKADETVFIGSIINFPKVKAIVKKSIEHHFADVLDMAWSAIRNPEHTEYEPAAEIVKPKNKAQ